MTHMLNRRLSRLLFVLASSVIGAYEVAECADNGADESRLKAVLVAGYAGDGVAPLAGELHEPFAVALTADNRLLIAELAGQRLLALGADGQLGLLAGDGQAGYAGDGGPAQNARFNSMHHLVVMPNGDVLIADTLNCRVRKIDAKTGVVSTIVGTGRRGFSGDGGPATKADCGGIYCLAIDVSQNRLLFVDLDNRRVRAVDLASGTINTLAGNGQKGIPQDGATAREAPLVDPRAVASDQRGNVFILERSGHALRVVDSEGRVRTVAGSGKKGPPVKTAPALEATFNGPKHLVVDARGDVIIADAENHVIRKWLAREQRVVLLAGSGKQGNGGVGGPALEVELNRPHGVFVDPAGSLYIADSENHRILKLVPNVP